MDPERARERIAEEQARVRGLIDEVRAELSPSDDSGGGFDDFDESPADTASETFEREKDLSILEELEAELAELEAALRRVDDGTYGIDEVTGKPIDPERLDAVPAARTNVDTNPARRSGTEPASRSGTEPARRSGTEPARRSGTEPASRSGTEQARRSGTEPAP
jgi:RNA polymerase-binding transcription factor DksA